jgi:hypothetical protein
VVVVDKMVQHLVLVAVDQDTLRMTIIIYPHNFLMLPVLEVQQVVPLVQHQEQHPVLVQVQVMLHPHMDLAAQVQVFLVKMMVLVDLDM